MHGAKFVWRITVHNSLESSFERVSNKLLPGPRSPRSWGQASTEAKLPHVIFSWEDF